MTRCHRLWCSFDRWQARSTRIHLMEFLSFLRKLHEIACKGCILLFIDCPPSVFGSTLAPVLDLASLNTLYETGAHGKMNWYLSEISWPMMNVSLDFLILHVRGQYSKSSWMEMVLIGLLWEICNRIRDGVLHDGGSLWYTALEKRRLKTKKFLKSIII